MSSNLRRYVPRCRQYGRDVRNARIHAMLQVNHVHLTRNSCCVASPSWLNCQSMYRCGGAMWMQEGPAPTAHSCSAASSPFRWADFRADAPRAGSPRAGVRDSCHTMVSDCDGHVSGDADGGAVAFMVAALESYVTRHAHNHDLKPQPQCLYSV